MRRAYRIDPPARNDIHCRHCLREIEAVAVISGDLEIAGIREYRWLHVTDHQPTCTRTYVAAPYDAWDATRRIKEVTP